MSLSMLPNLQIQTHCLENGLTDLKLISPKREPQMSSPKASPHPKLMHAISFPPNGDYIGTESCIDLQIDDSFHLTDSSSTAPISHGGGNKKNLIRSNNNLRKKKEKKEFPPLIPLLARTENLHSHMPWVLKRYYTSDGRLILKEEKVRHHEYLRAHRANGRLTLQLVPLDNNVLEDDRFSLNDEFRWKWNNEDEESSTWCETNEDISSTSNNGGNNSISRCVDEYPKALENDQKARCFKNNRLRSTTSCIFGMRLHPIRTIHG